MAHDIGILGMASFYGPAYARRANRRADCRLVAASPLGVADESLRALSRPPRSEFAETFDCEIHSDRESVLRAVDAVVVASPTTRRGEDARHALESDTDVLCAKPAVRDHADARALATTANRTAASATFTTPARYDDAIGDAVRRVRQGAIGDVLAVRARIRHDRVPAAGIDVNPEHAPDQAGAAYAMAVYTADTLLWLAPTQPKSVTAEYVNANTPHSAHPDLGTATVRFQDGVLGSMTMTYSTDCREPWGNWELEVVGSDGIIRTSHQGYEGIHWSGGDPDQRSTRLFGRTTSPVLDRAFDAFVDSIAGDRPAVTPDAQHVANAIGLCEAWENAATAGRISFDSWPPASLE